MFALIWLKHLPRGCTWVFHSMNLFLAFVVWLVSSTSAVVIADSIVNGISTDKDPVGNPSEDEAIKLGDGIGSEWIASPCGGDVIVNPAKLRARREPCDPHKSPDTPTTGNIKIPIPEDNDNGYGNGDRGILKKYPPYKDFLYIAPSNRAPPLGPTEYRRCPQSGGTTAPDGYMYLICHVGPASDLHIVWVENTMNCMSLI